MDRSDMLANVYQQFLKNEPELGALEQGEFWANTIATWNPKQRKEVWYQDRCKYLYSLYGEDDAKRP